MENKELVKEYWFNIDDARTAEECKNRTSAWQPFVKLEHLMSEAEAHISALTDLPKALKIIRKLIEQRDYFMDFVYDDHEEQVSVTIQFNAELEAILSEGK